MSKLSCFNPVANYRFALKNIFQRNYYILPALILILFILNTADYLTTVYALENIPVAQESNPRVPNLDVAFKVKILYGVPFGIGQLFLALFMERMRFRYDFAFVYFCYFLFLVPTVAVVIQYVWVVTTNFHIILVYS